MLNKGKIKLMSELALYEEKEGRQNDITNSYFKIDFISKHMLGSFFSYTLCFLIAFVISILYHSDDIFAEVDIMNVVTMFKPYLFYYLIGLAIFELITAIVSNSRYNYAKGAQRVENAKLKRLQKRYELGDKSMRLGGR